MVSAQNLSHAAFVGYTTLDKPIQTTIDRMLRGLDMHTMEQHISNQRAYKLGLPGRDDVYALIINDYRVIVSLKPKATVEVIDIINKRFRDSLFTPTAA